MQPQRDVCGTPSHRRKSASTSPSPCSEHVAWIWDGAKSNLDSTTRPHLVQVNRRGPPVNLQAGNKACSRRWIAAWIGVRRQGFGREPLAIRGRTSLALLEQGDRERTEHIGEVRSDDFKRPSARSIDHLKCYQVRCPKRQRAASDAQRSANTACCSSTQGRIAIRIDDPSAIHVSASRTRSIGNAGNVHLIGIRH